MTFIKKIASILLVFIMIMQSFCIIIGEDGVFDGMIAFAATSGTCGDNLTWTLDDEGTLTISGTGEMDDWSSESGFRAPWYSSRNSINDVVIGEGVTYIGEHAFYKCDMLNGVDFPDSVITIGDDAFNRCDSLSQIEIFIVNTAREIFNSARKPIIRKERLK